MSLSIHLLGSPRIERDGAPVEPPRGHKSWGLLAYLLRSRLPPSRERLASLLFPEADDPLGTLRWTLSALRSRLGDAAELGGDPLQLRLQPGSFVDVDVLERGSWMEAVALPGLGHELLDGIAFRSSPGFELWLENERRHIDGMTSAVLHQAALAHLRTWGGARPTPQPGVRPSSSG
jgi:DNA-binding SARP family transcriptional activator